MVVGVSDLLSCDNLILRTVQYVASSSGNWSCHNTVRILMYLPVLCDPFKVARTNQLPAQQHIFLVARRAIGGVLCSVRTFKYQNNVLS